MRRFALFTGILGLIGVVVYVTSSRADGPEPEKIDFNTHIRPILSDNCFACHGPDEKTRKGKLRLDTDADFLADRGGYKLLVANDVNQSELFRRIVTSNPREQMPPPKSGKQLTAEQIALLKRWIEQGAEYRKHWAFIPPKRPELPKVKNTTWPRNPLDYFILARLEQEGLQPSPEADRRTLIRRVTLDLTGLPPTPAEVEAFVNDPSPDAYEKVVDRLLASPRYGEHRARYWLDVARYGDTHGLHLDNYREIWPYRDWLIQAFNQNMPFDQFVMEQLAGDLLPNPTLDQLVATGFNRCHVTTSEGGSIAEEVYVRNVVDCVETTGTVFLGLTMGCAVCHDHKYDPLSQTEFYQMFAFFNSIDGNPLDGNNARHPPVAQVPTPEQKQQLDGLRQQIATTQREIQDQLAAHRYIEPETPLVMPPPQPEEIVWIDDDVPAGATPHGNWQWVTEPVYSGQRASTRNAAGLDQHFFTGAAKPLTVAKNDRLFAYVYLDPQNPPQQIMMQWNDGNWEHRAYWGDNQIIFGRNGTPSRWRIGSLPKPGQWVRLEVEAAKVGLAPGAKINGWAFTQYGGTVYWDKAGIVKVDDIRVLYDSLARWEEDQRKSPKSDLPPDIQALIQLNPEKRTAAQNKRLTEYFVEFVDLRTRDTFDPLHQRLEQLQRQLDGLEKATPTTLIWKELAQPKPAYVLIRGEYDKKGPKVERQTPSVLPPMSPELPRDRLGFARWLLAPDQPLTARVAVNRFWQQYFGTGIVKTSEDFGSQGDPPSHPELLDWLAMAFMTGAFSERANGERSSPWNVKQLHKLIVMSATYRQSSKVTPQLLAKDPNNRLLARGPRFRLDAEMVRDQALFVSGLLVEKIGGPSVKPPQPAGLWEAVGYTSSNTARFTADTGPDKVFRRSMYTFWKRTSPPPQMTIIDAPSRESCTARRERTNTPLQALLLMNETQFVEASRHLAQRVLKEGGTTTDQRLAHLFRIATARRPDSRELSILHNVLSAHLAEYKQNPDAAQALIRQGEIKPDDLFDAVELAAWTMVANLVLNLDEVVTKG
ncbi:MAG: PSD1 and planctomycete cytochrome C domain-containing protein [Gemmataceae bacterium]